jgi:N-acetylglutamate synthase-like GNAT family acetyltransferase
MTPIAVATPSLAQAVQLLRQAGLPTEDLADAPGLRLLGVRRDGGWIGVIGVQPLDGAALLRSLAVAPSERGRGQGTALVAAAESLAVESGWRQLYLLTTGAAAFFGRLGFEVISREQAPAELRATRQFAQLCPATALVMCKRLGATG